MMVKRKLSSFSGLRKKINNKIEIYLQRHLTSKSIAPSDVDCVQVVVSGDHGDTAFQFGAAVSVTLFDDHMINFEVSVCELICWKETGKLIESTILPTLSRGLDIIATWHLHIETSKQGQIECKFRETQTLNSRTINMYITGNLAFQAMALEKS
jgi:hypothetical protein